MKLSYPYLSEVFIIENQAVNTLVVESQKFFREILLDIKSQTEGCNGNTVLSDEGVTLSFSKYAEIITDFLSFDINRKELLTRVVSALEKEAYSETNFMQTQELLSSVESYIDTLAFEYSCDIVPTKIHMSGILKSAGILIQCDSKDPLDMLLDYMELVREFDHDKLFITVNLRSYYNDETILKFMETVLAHDYKVFMIENKDYPVLAKEKRRTVDEDLCEF